MSKDYDLLKYLHETTREELAYRRQRELHIFNWSNAILLAIAGTTSMVCPDNYSLFKAKAVTSIMIAAIIIWGLTYFSVKWQLYQRQQAAEQQKVLAKILQQLGYFDNADSVLPRSWKDWGKKDTKFVELIKKSSRISATLLSGSLALLTLLIRAVS